MRWREMFWLWAAPPDAVGWLDWASGLIHLDVTVQELQTIMESSERDARQRVVLSTLTHESMHFAQIVTAGYPYGWALRFFDLVNAGFQHLVPDVLGGGDLKRIAVAAGDQLSGKTAAELAEHVDKLYATGSSGVSVRNLMEAHALMIELMMHHRPVAGGALAAPDILTLLDTECPSLEYRYAYDLARLWLPPHAAFALFPAIAFASLCASDPPAAFVSLLRASRAAQIVEAPGRAEWLRFVNEVLGDTLLGSAAEVFNAHPQRHPIYGPVVLALNERATPGGFDVVDFMLHPAEATTEFIKDIIRPIVLRPTEDEKLSLWSTHHVEEEIVPLLILSALANGVTRTLPPERGLPTESLKPLAWVSERDDAVRDLQFDAATLEGPVDLAVDTLLGTFVRAGWDEGACTAWGSLTLSFELGEEDIVARHPWVRTFVAKVHERAPWFPIFLDLAPALGMLFNWLGALAEEQAWAGPNTLNLGHPSVITTVVKVCTAIDRFAAERGHDPTPQLDLILALYPEEMAQTLGGLLGDPRRHEWFHRAGVGS